MKQKKRIENYRFSAFLSLVAHLVFVIFILAWRFDTKQWEPTPTVYQVELVSAVKKAAAVQTKVPDKIPELVKPKEPEQPISIKPPKEKENIEPPEEKKEKPKITPPKKEPEASELERTGQTTATEAPADSALTGTNRLKIDTQDFPFAWYLNLMRFRIKDNWKPPPGHQKKQSAIVSFRVLRNGKISNIKVERSSGHFIFDQAAQRAIHYASPLPPLPPEFYENHLSVHIEFEGF